MSFSMHVGNTEAGGNFASSRADFDETFLRPFHNYARLLFRMFYILFTHSDYSDLLPTATGVRTQRSLTPNQSKANNIPSHATAVDDDELHTTAVDNDQQDSALGGDKLDDNSELLLTTRSSPYPGLNLSDCVEHSHVSNSTCRPTTRSAVPLAISNSTIGITTVATPTSYVLDSPPSPHDRPDLADADTPCRPTTRSAVPLAVGSLRRLPRRAALAVNVTPPSTPPFPQPPLKLGAPKGAPKWVSDALSHMQLFPLPPRWTTCLEAWITFEQTMEYGVDVEHKVRHSPLTTQSLTVFLAPSR
jgi:hypothetical protein